MYHVSAKYTLGYCFENNEHILAVFWGQGSKYCGLYPLLYNTVGDAIIIIILGLPLCVIIH